MTEAGIYRSQLDFEIRFTRIPNEWVRDPRLSFKAKGLLTYLMSHEAEYKISFSQIAAQTSDGRSAIRSAIAELTEAGYLLTEQTKDARGYNAGLAYYLQNPESQNPKFENPTLDNRTAIKKTIIKENNLIKKSDIGEISGDFYPDWDNQMWAKEECPDVNTEYETPIFVNWWISHGGTAKDWQAKWRIWMIKAQRNGPSAPKGRRFLGNAF